MEINNNLNSRGSLYEIAIQPHRGQISQIKGLIYRHGQMFLKVPYERIQQEIKRIQRLGGKIVNITPTTAITPLGESTSLTQAKTETVVDEPWGISWWVEISTTHPQCLYYFGPFDDQEEAGFHQGGYIQDLLGEGAQNITVRIKQCQPLTLTQEWPD
ncbi:MAG TPA: CpcD phycobilisome linker protein [Cyanothece sp. UBA12306]|nr:CpcD phycobilisome linker protein [Cyanothece sp. UBA12306]